jgi:ferric-dicitrate binding protein FerR (iron transport regulator)
MTPKDSAHVPVKEIILRFLEGIASDEEILSLRAWLEENEANRKYFDEVNNTFQASVTLNRLNHHKVENAWEKLSQRIDESPTLHGARTRHRYLVVLKIAASICLLAVAGSLLFKIAPKNKAQQQVTIVGNSKGNNTRILLPDSSIVWLNTNSTLEYTPEFGKLSREVRLKGEAFFDVKKDSKAFIVRTDNMQIHVKGTRFNVEAYKKNATVKTTLEEGKVELHVDGNDKFFTMKPGDQIILNTQLHDVIVQKVDPSDFSAWKEEKLIFDNTPLTEVIAKLENRYKVNITIKSEKAKRERLSMTIEQEDIQEVLDLIKLSSRLQIKTEKNEIILFD